MEFTPDKAGEFGFACGMNMLHGTLIVEEGKEHAVAPVLGKGAGESHEHAVAVGVGPTMPVGKTEQVEFTVIGGGITCPTCAVNIETDILARVIISRLEAVGDGFKAAAAGGLTWQQLQEGGFLP